jgi:hypothetical protein
VNAVRGMVSVGMVVTVVTLIGVWLSTESYAQTPDKASIAGAWAMNKTLSDEGSSARGDESGGDRSPRNGGGGRRGGFGRGGGGGFGRGGGYGRANGTPQLSPDEAARMRDATRDVLDPPDHLVITETESMILLTSPDGRTTRLSPDGKSIKDDSTKVERKTKWADGKLVSEISGLGPKMTQTFAINPELHQLRVTVQVDANGQAKARTVTHVYDADTSR